MMLSITGLRKKLGRREILKGIDAELEAGVVGLLGANGAGKTTIIRCLTGIYDLDAGTVAYEGEDIQKSKTYRPNLGYLPQAFGMFRELTVYEMMDYFCALKKVPKEKRPAMIEDCLQKVNLEDRIRSRVSTLSGGMVRRVGIAQSLLGDARVIIMDEPTSGLDPQERARFKNMVARMKGQDKAGADFDAYRRGCGKPLRPGAGHARGAGVVQRGLRGAGSPGPRIGLSSAQSGGSSDQRRIL